MKILKFIFIALLSLLSVLVIVGFFLPSQYTVRESITIQAPAEEVFQAVNSFKAWENWSPWNLMDPAQHVTYQGPAAGVGAIMAWHSKKKSIGTGKQEIVASDPNRYIKTALAFEGWDQPTHATWAFKELSENSTQVTWCYETEVGNHILHKYMSLLMQPFLKKNYKEGLERLKRYVEKA
jgi:ribosome-associated toxin RatA of RatAB toxin-antitoxin module